MPDSEGWPLVCRACGKTWALNLPPLPILASAYIRILNALSICVYCDSKDVDIALESVSAEITLSPQASALGDDLAQASGTDAEPSKEEPKPPSLKGKSEDCR